jgi:hypothetical protein
MLKQSRRLLRRFRSLVRPAPPAPFSILDHFVHSAPSPQSTLDIFKGEWASRLSGEYASLQAGSSELFADTRIDWAVEQLGGVKGQRVLELGPLEGGHSSMLERHGAAEVVAVEANTRAYLKCLLIKELLQLTKVRFLCGDFMAYLREGTGRFDACIACGVLYHLRQPVELIARLAGVTDRLFLWTHYYDHDTIARQARLTGHFSEHTPAEYAGFRHTLHRLEYGQSLQTKRFWGGSAAFTHWLSRADVLACLNYFGFRDLRIAFDTPDHANGPSFAVAALRG